MDEGGAGLGQGEKEGQAGGELLAAGGVVRSSPQTLHDVAGGCHLPLPEGDDGGLALFPPHHVPTLLPQTLATRPSSSPPLPTMGLNITCLQLQELWSFKYSLLSAIKRSCLSLEKLVVLMTCKEVVGAVAQIC